MGKLQMEIQLISPLKKTEKEGLIQSIISSFEDEKIKDVKIEDVYYTEEREEFGPLTLVMIISTIADVLSIALAIRTFLRKKKPKGIREFHLRVDTKSLVIKGEMSADDITKILEEARKKE